MVFISGFYLLQRLRNAFFIRQLDVANYFIYFRGL